MTNKNLKSMAQLQNSEIEIFKLNIEALENENKLLNGLWQKEVTTFKNKEK